MPRKCQSGCKCKKHSNRRGVDLSKINVDAKLDEDNSLMREKLKSLGYQGLITVITKKRLGKGENGEVVNALVSLRNIWLTRGYEDKRVLDGTGNKEESADGFLTLPSRRGNLQSWMTGNDDSDNDSYEDLL